MNARFLAALAASRLASALSRKLHLGGGTVLPGRLAARIDPSALPHLAASLPGGCALVSGTNGKTTTARMLAAIVRAAGLEPVHNRAGANLAAGVLAALTERATWSGQAGADLGVFEVDEAQLPAVIVATRPRALALTNLFRDQLDRYGEVDFLAHRWEQALGDLRPGQLVANVDDPVLAYLVGGYPGPRLTFGLQDPAPGAPELAHDADRRLCPACGGRLDYRRSYYGHLGHYGCPGCGWERPPPALALTRVQAAETGTRLTFQTQSEEHVVETPISGLHNAYNAAAAAAAALALGLGWPSIRAGLAQTDSVFGRNERIPVGDGSLTLCLVKNPVGFNQSLRAALPQLTDALIVINDRLADGTDVSWLWDVDFELLAQPRPAALCSGLRAHDMALRLKYAGIEAAVQPNDASALDWALERARAGRAVVAFCTYTATLEVRRRLQRRGLVAPFWEN